MSCAKNFTVKLLDHTIYDCSLIYINMIFKYYLFVCLSALLLISFIIMSLYTQNVGDVSPTNLSPDGSPATSCDEGETRRSVYTELYWVTCSMMLTMMLTRIKSHVDDRVACYIFSIRIGFLYFQISVNLLGTYLANLICFKVTKKIKQCKWV